MGTLTENQENTHPLTTVTATYTADMVLYYMIKCDMI
jgi:hypothetical protein